MDTTTPKYILSILRTNLNVLFSWGAHNFTAENENTLAFMVEGFLFKGRVKVIYDYGSDTFVVRLIKRTGEVQKEETEVYFDNLIDVIDGLVERCPNYEERVRKEYGIVNR